ncbi:hypothetical protein AOQ84DRAFT_227258 [Glonium stellatum]|uniref:Uncharacterized protein n=1 Tax=Glonium stellatum TaxID=574774 RepID=A0A8E2ERL2_9PEZI|nr:hypothetical protein AOQ84DRAFT_227258 [Glonium stellatum]
MTKLNARRRSKRKRELGGGPEYLVETWTADLKYACEDLQTFYTLFILTRRAVYVATSANEFDRVPAIYSQDTYLSKNRSVVRNAIRRDNFRAMKGQPISVLNMIFHRDFDPGHNFHPNSLQNRFNRAMISAQARAGLAPTPLHIAFMAAMAEARETPDLVEKRGSYVKYWAGFAGDFYILTAPEECVWRHRLTSVLLGRNIEEGEVLDVSEKEITNAGPLSAENLGTTMWARMKHGIDPGYDTLKNLVITEGRALKFLKLDGAAGGAQGKLRTVTDDDIEAILVEGGGGEWLSEFFKTAMEVIVDEDIRVN